MFAMTASSRATFTVESCVRGYHVYKDIWDATVGEELECARESDNPADRYAFAMKKGDKQLGMFRGRCQGYARCFWSVTASFSAPLLVLKDARWICLKEDWNYLAR